MNKMMKLMQVQTSLDRIIQEQSSHELIWVKYFSCWVAISESKAKKDK